MLRIDRLTGYFAPLWTARRMAAREAMRSYEAASLGRRGSGHGRMQGDATRLVAAAGKVIREKSRDLVANNGWIRRAQTVWANNATGGWGLQPRPDGPQAARVSDIWRRWAGTESTECDADRRTNLGGLQAAVVRALFTDGEVLIRRRPRSASDGLTIPLQLQVLEADHLDSARSGPNAGGGQTVAGVEFDSIGRRTAYWLFPSHPGAVGLVPAASRPVPASEVLHIYVGDRPGQVRGISWLTAAILTTADLDGHEDAELMRQKIAACFAAFVVDADGTSTPVGETEAGTSPRVETFEPGMITYLEPGKSVAFGNPPATTDTAFATRVLRKIAAACGVTYEDLTGDYSQVNYSSARMGRLVHGMSVAMLQATVLIPQLCAPIFRWAMEAAALAGSIDGTELPGAEWTVPPLPMIDPEKEGLAYQRIVRAGAMTPSEMVRERGGDPAVHWAQYAADLAELDRLGIKLDVDVRAVSQAGLTQERASGG